jgi:alkylated DNA repair dioxygenase AlkB
MSFSPIGRRDKSIESIELVLPQRSILVMEGTARYRFTHEIKARKFDQIDGMKRHRKRRVSLTFRSLASQNK